MNATRWVTLTEFVKHLGREGIVHVDENEQGWFISWIDNSPAALKRQAALQKMERARIDDEGRERKRLKEQISSAQKEQGQSGSDTQDAASVGLQRDASSGPIRLGLGASSSTPSEGAKTSTSSGQQSTVPKPSISFSTSKSTSSSTASKKPAAFKNPLKASSNPLKGSSSSSGSSKSQHQPQLSMAEKIRLEEEEKRRQQMETSDKRKFNGPMPSSNGGLKRIRM